MSTITAITSIHLRMNGTSVERNADSSGWVLISSWPVTVSNSVPSSLNILNVKCDSSLDISSTTGGTNGYFIAGSQYITFDGSGNSININGITGYLGFIRNGTSGTNGKSNIIVQNFTTNANSSTLKDNAGWLCQSYFGRASLGNSIENCINTGNLTTHSGGGIIGSQAGSFSGAITLTNCTNYGSQSSFNLGGVVGSGAGYSNGSVIVTKCINHGNIATDCGGVVGSFAAHTAGSVTLVSCINTGNITANSGGMVGQNAAAFSGAITLTNCTNTGVISGGAAGGMVGQNVCSVNGRATLTNCMNSGNITGAGAGGIVGGSFGYNTNETCSIINCYSISNISGSRAGGITGQNIGQTDGAYTPVVNITNCYSLGAIATTCGGICGGLGPAYSYVPIVTITNCYSYGVITGTGSGIVAAGLPFTPTQTNVYVANGTWSDATANANLTDTPTGTGIANGQATIWTSISVDTPYLLSSYFSLSGYEIFPQIYTPNSVSAYDNGSSGPGLYQPGLYSLANTNQWGNTLTAKIYTVGGTSPIYYGYGYTTYSITNINGGSGRLITATINETTGVISYILPFPCFLEGTKILCFENNEEVYRPIQDLRKGELVKTIYNGYMPINMIGTSKVYNPGNNDRIVNRIYKCSKELYPSLIEDLYITGCHSILVPCMTDDQWENTKAINGNIYVTDNHFRLIAYADEKAEPFNKEGYMNIYHVALDHHDICMNYGIYANGLLVESCSIDYLIKYSNMKILEDNTNAVYENNDNELNNIMCRLVDTC